MGPPSMTDLSDLLRHDAVLFGLSALGKKPLLASLAAALALSAVLPTLGAVAAGFAAVGLVAGLAQSLGKVSLDATIQESVPARVQASAFALSDTTLQLAWVVGGFVGIALPLYPRLGLGVAAAVLAAWTFFVLATRTRRGQPAVGGAPV